MPKNDCLTLTRNPPNPKTNRFAYRSPSDVRWSHYRYYWKERRMPVKTQPEIQRRWWRIGEHHWTTFDRSSRRMDRSAGTPWRRTACSPSQWSRRLRSLLFLLWNPKYVKYSQCRCSSRRDKRDSFLASQNPREANRDDFARSSNRFWCERFTVVWKYFFRPKLVISLYSDLPFQIAPAKTNNRPTAQILWWIIPGGSMLTTSASSPSPCV